MRRGWSKAELLDLLETSDAGGDCWGYCSKCGAEIYPLEPDAVRAWCETCGEEVPVKAGPYMGCL